MTDEVLEMFVRQYIEAQTTSDVLFTWHGGEPLLRPLTFYEKALRLQREYAHGRRIDNCLQTNGTLLTDEWGQFLAANGFLVGISIDGPQHVHDANRGRTFDRVMRGIDILNRYGVMWNAMATVNSANVNDPVGFYNFFKAIGARYIQFEPIVPLPALSVAGQGISGASWGQFLVGLFDEWVKADVGKVFVQLFDATLSCWVGVPPGMCSLAPSCGHAAVMEHNGDLYSCDHFVYPEYFLGNIRQRTITAMMYSEEQLAFGQRKCDALTRQCRECEFLFTCHGECPKNRFVRDKYGNEGHNYLCEGYHRFFTHVSPYMDDFASQVGMRRLERPTPTSRT